MPIEMASLDDAALVQMAVAGHEEYFTELVHRHMNAVRKRVLAIVRNSADADDVVQEVFLKAWRALPTFRAEAAVRTWLISIANNESLMLYRRERRRNWLSLGGCHSLASDSEPADKAIIRSEENLAVHKAVLRLPLVYRQVVTLRDFEQLSAIATAEQLKSTLPAVKTRLFRGRLKLAAALRRSRAQTLMRAA